MNSKATGIGTRCINFVVDSLLVFIIAYIGFKVHQWYVYYYRITPYYFGWFYAAATVVYYTILESVFGRTLGKWFSQTRVVDQKGLKPGFLAVLVRSLIRLTVIDMFFFPFLDRTLHDYVSRTDVVQI